MVIQLQEMRFSSLFLKLIVHVIMIGHSSMHFLTMLHTATVCCKVNPWTSYLTGCVKQWPVRNTLNLVFLIQEDERDSSRGMLFYTLTPKTSLTPHPHPSTPPRLPVIVLLCRIQIGESSPHLLLPHVVDHRQL